MSLPLRTAAAGVAVALSVAWLSGQGKTPSVQVLLERAGGFLADYQRQAPSVVSEEIYEQTSLNDALRALERRRTRSDVLVIANDATDWVVFRDVFEVDGKPLRDRDERLETLLLHPSSDAFAQAQRIAAESARFNVNFRGLSFSRTLNNPMMALRFLTARNQHRSQFRIAGTSVIAGVNVVELRFEEQKTPRVLVTPSDSAAAGKFWIEPASGRVLRSEVRIQTAVFAVPIASTIRMSFAIDPKIGLQVPVGMDEIHVMGAGVYQSIEARATYSKFRKFSVDVSTILKNQH